MTIDEKYKIVRKAALAMVNVPDDDRSHLLGLLGEIHRELDRATEEDREDALLAIGLLVALLETHDEKQS